MGGGGRGFCFKDFLRTNSSALSRGGTSPGRTADTMRGVLTILEHRALDRLLLENVDPMEDAGSALDALLWILAEKGYGRPEQCYGIGVAVAG